MIDATRKKFDDNGLTLSPPSSRSGGDRSMSYNPRSSSVTTFLTRLAECEGLPSPSGRGGRLGGKPLVFLSSSLTKTNVFDMYIEASHKEGVKDIGERMFQHVWKERCSHIRIM